MPRSQYSASSAAQNSDSESAVSSRPRRKKRPCSPAVHAPKLGLRPDEAADVVGGEGLFRAMRTAGWVTPVHQSNNVTVFDYADVARAWSRLRAGEKP